MATQAAHVHWRGKRFYHCRPPRNRTTYPSIRNWIVTVDDLLMHRTGHRQCRQVQENKVTLMINLHFSMLANCYMLLL